MNDPRQPAPVTPAPTAPRPATIPHPQQPTAHPQQHPTPGMAPAAPRPPIRPAGAPQAPAHHAPQPVHHPAQPSGGAKIAAMPTMPIAKHDEDAIALIEEEEGGLDAVTLHKKIKAFGTNDIVKTTKWKRVPAAHGQGGPIRVRTFHAKLSDQGLEYLDEAINHFIDDHPEIDVKQVTTNVGMFDGKFKDLALIVNVWY